MKFIASILLSLFCASALAAPPPIIWGAKFSKILQPGLQFTGVNGATACTAATAGSIRYNSGTFEGCNGTAWSAMTGGGGGTPGGANGAVQFNNSSAFGGDATNFFWDSTNKRLGIGTATPTASIHSALTANAANSIYLTNAGTGTLSRSFMAIGEDTSTKDMGFGYSNASYDATGIEMLAANSAWEFANSGADFLTLIAGKSSGAIRFATGGFATANERMRLTSTGLGLGMTPNFPLDITVPAGVFYSININQPSNDVVFRQTANGHSTTIGASFAGGVFIGSETSEKVNFRANNTVYATLDTVGNFGISTTSPGYPLDIKPNTDTAGLRLQGAGVGTGAAIILDASLNSSGGLPWEFFSSGSGNGDIGGSKFGIRDLSQSGATSYRLVIDSSGHIIYGGSAPAVSACGTSPSVAGNDVTGRITVGTGGVATSCTLTFAHAFAHSAVCTIGDESTSLLLKGSASTTVLTITAATPFGASDKIVYNCFDYE